MKLRVLALSAIVTALAVVALPTASGASTTAARNGCPAPGSVSSYHVYGLYQHGDIGCDHAKHLLIENLAHHRHHSYTCNHRISGRNVHMHCTSTLNSAHQYSASYYVH